MPAERIVYSANDGRNALIDFQNGTREVEGILREFVILHETRDRAIERLEELLGGDGFTTACARDVLADVLKILQGTEVIQPEPVVDDRKALIAWVQTERARALNAAAACRDISGPGLAHLHFAAAEKFQAIAELLTADEELLKSAVELKRIAREAINSWACVAKANRDFEYIGATHRALDAIVLRSEGQ